MICCICKKEITEGDEHKIEPHELKERSEASVIQLDKYVCPICWTKLIPTWRKFKKGLFTNQNNKKELFPTLNLILSGDLEEK